MERKWEENSDQVLATKKHKNTKEKTQHTAAPHRCSSGTQHTDGLNAFKPNWEQTDAQEKNNITRKSFIFTQCTERMRAGVKHKFTLKEPWQMFALDLRAHSLKLQNPRRSREKQHDQSSVCSLLRKKLTVSKNWPSFANSWLVTTVTPLMLKV